MRDLSYLVDELSGLTLLEASELARLLRGKWGIEDSVPPLLKMADQLVQEIERPPEKDSFDLALLDFGPSKISVIKLVRQYHGPTSLGLKEAKELVETPGAILLSSVSKEIAEDAKRQFESVGAVMEIR